MRIVAWFVSLSVLFVCMLVCVSGRMRMVARFALFSVCFVCVYVGVRLVKCAMLQSLVFQCVLFV